MPATLKTRARQVRQLPTDEEDTRIHAGIAADPGSPALDADGFKRARPAAAVVPPDVCSGRVALQCRPGGRGP